MKQNIKNILINSLIIITTFVIVTAMAMMLEHQTFFKYMYLNTLTPTTSPDFSYKRYYWDVEHYGNLVLNFQCIAFYPLWSWLIKNLFHPQTLDQTAYYFRFTSLTIFIVSIPLFFSLCYKIFKNSKLSLVISLLFTINPFAIFRVIGYTESLFTFLSILLFYLIRNKMTWVNLILVSITVILLSVTRPILIQFSFSAIITFLTLFALLLLRRNQKNQISLFSYSQLKRLIKEKINEIKLTLNVIISSVIGYSIYGIYCLQTRNNFFAPFSDQKLWNKKLGFHPELLILPRSQIYDIWGLYFPILIIILITLIIFTINYHQKIKLWIPKSKWFYLLLIYPPLFTITYLWQTLKLKNTQIYSKKLRFKVYRLYLKVKDNYLFWFCSYFSLSQSLIVFLTQDRLVSLARYIFAVPLFFISLGFILSYFIKSKNDYNIIWFTLGISGITLIEQWLKYGQNSWIG